jgi:small-conductance mechanosensitive channel
MNLNELISPLVSSAILIVLTILGLVIGQLISRRATRLIQATSRFHEGRRQQLLTLVYILRWAASAMIAGIGLLMLLSTIGVDITPLLASVGVASLAISLGAQTLIKDLVGGLLILVENQYAVGDTIHVGSVSGQVERLTLRATYVRSCALVDVGVAYEEDIDRALCVLKTAAEAFAQVPEFEPHLLETPKVLGPLALADWSVTVRLTVKTKPGKQWKVARGLRRQILVACEQEGVTLPYPRQEVWVRGQGPDHPEPGNERGQTGKEVH